MDVLQGIRIIWWTRWTVYFWYLFWQIFDSRFADYRGVIPHPQWDGIHRGADPGGRAGREFFSVRCSRVVSHLQPDSWDSSSFKGKSLLVSNEPVLSTLAFFFFDRLLQGQFPRHRLVKQSSQAAETAISAFNPPKEAAASTSETHSSPPSSTGTARGCVSGWKMGPLYPVWTFLMAGRSGNKSKESDLTSDKIYYLRKQFCESSWS